MALSRIDVHHHYFPPGLFANTNASTSEWPSPLGDAWTPDISIDTMNKLGIQKAILSLPFAYPNAQVVNINMSNIVKAHPDRFGFFATLPVGFASMDAVLAELDYALDVLKADGVALVSAYGTGATARYVGNDDFAPLWQALHNRKATVFLHGAQTKSSNAAPNALLPGPIVEVPNETYKAASDLVTSGKKRKYSNAKIILSHSGGSTPFLAARVAVLSNYVGVAKNLPTLSINQILDDFKDFYYETALSGYDVNLIALEQFVAKDHILYGTDYPAVTLDSARWYTKNVDKYFARNPSTLKDIMSKNWAKLRK